MKTKSNDLLGRRKRCWLFHRWRVVRDTGFTVYSECLDCESRKIKQPPTGYQPINTDWLAGPAIKQPTDHRPSSLPIVADPAFQAAIGLGISSSHPLRSPALHGLSSTNSAARTLPRARRCVR